MEKKYKFLELLIGNIGKPYDFFFGIETRKETAYFCTGLINDTLRKVGYETHVLTINESSNIIDNIMETSFTAHRILKPEQMIYGNFTVKYTSSNIVKENEKYIFKKGKIHIIAGK